MADNYAQEVMRKFGPNVYYKDGQYYTNGQQFGTEQGLLDYQRERTRIGRENRQLKEDLGRYDTYANQFRNDVTNRFNAAAEYAGGQATGAVAAGANLAGQRAGLGDAYTAALNADAAAKLRSQVLGSQLNFQTAMEQAAYEDRMGFVKGEFGFLHQLQAMDQQFEYSKDLARLTYELQSNAQSQSLWGDMLEIGGTVLGMSFLGPIGGAAGAVAGSLLGGSSRQYNPFGPSGNPLPLGG